MFSNFLFSAFFLSIFIQFAAPVTAVICYCKQTADTYNTVSSNSNSNNDSNNNNHIFLPLYETLN